eukprot:Phypoly_transcript_17339.p1 GENE.Phypoly_transcript_17339~~Phypoly_transcript_17339.p1  ORF type:complete len:211 (+),score=27.72 Phypoly_transcript_17339:102-734(+)
MAQQVNRRKKHLFKIILLGDSGTGKTSLMGRFVNNKFSQQYRATIGADFLTKDIVVGDIVATLQIWDTAGGDRFQTLGTHFYRGTDACMLVYDVHLKKTFENLESWRTQFIEMSHCQNSESFPFVCVGNKSDLTDTPSISKTMVEDWCAQKGMSRFDVSAKDGTNVEQAFLKLITLAIEKQKDDPVWELPASPGPLPPPAPPSESCCTIL